MFLHYRKRLWKREKKDRNDSEFGTTSQKYLQMNWTPFTKRKLIILAVLKGWNYLAIVILLIIIQVVFYFRLGISELDLKDTPRGLRLEAIHCRGVDDMSTEAVLEYFRAYAPGSLEWIDDSSCKIRTPFHSAYLHISQVVLIYKLTCFN